MSKVNGTLWLYLALRFAEAGLEPDFAALETGFPEGDTAFPDFGESAFLAVGDSTLLADFGVPAFVAGAGVPDDVLFFADFAGAGVSADVFGDAAGVSTDFLFFFFADFAGVSADLFCEGPASGDAAGLAKSTSASASSGKGSTRVAR